VKFLEKNRNFSKICPENFIFCVKLPVKKQNFPIKSNFFVKLPKKIEILQIEFF